MHLRCTGTLPCTAVLIWGPKRPQAQRLCPFLTALLIWACRDGTTSTVLFIGELMKQAERYLGEGLHPRIIVDVSGVRLFVALSWFVDPHRGMRLACKLQSHAPVRMHTVLPTCAAQGYDLARKAALEFLETFKQSVDPGDREVMRCVARTSLTTKLAQARCAAPSFKACAAHAGQTETQGVIHLLLLSGVLSIMAALLLTCVAWYNAGDGGPAD